MFRKKNSAVCLVCREELPWFDQSLLSVIKCTTDHCWVLWRWIPGGKKMVALDWPGKAKERKCTCSSCQALGR